MLHDHDRDIDLAHDHRAIADAQNGRRIEEHEVILLLHLRDQFGHALRIQDAQSVCG